MNKVKMFFIAAALVLTTAGVFAGKAKFAQTGQLVGYYNGGYYTISNPGQSFSGLTTGGTQATAFDGAHTYALYIFNSPTYTAVSAINW